MTYDSIACLKAREPQLMSSREAAKILGCHQETIYKWSKKGHLSHTRVGGRVKFSAAQFIAYLEGKTV